MNKLLPFHAFLTRLLGLSACGGGSTADDGPSGLGAACTTNAECAGGGCQLHLVDAAGMTVARSEGTVNDELLVHQPPADGQLFVQVVGFSGARNTYDLTIYVDCP